MICHYASFDLSIVQIDHGTTVPVTTTSRLLLVERTGAFMLCGSGRTYDGVSTWLRQSRRRATVENVTRA